MELIANRLALADVMNKLASVRPVFHSEADFEFAFAQTVWSLDPSIRLRLEVPARNLKTRRSEYIDMVCIADSVTRIEFKYAMGQWDGTDGITDERFVLRNHAAMDLARHGFIHDVSRLERLTTDPNDNGLAIMLTNCPALWEPATTASRDAAFRIHEGQRITGELTWGTPERPYPKNDRSIRRQYTAHWRKFSQPQGCKLRWLGWAINPQDA
ncbi:MAG: hypothetical protein ABIR57_00695 [Aeromicrobium sp.]